MTDYSYAVQNVLNHGAAPVWLLRDIGDIDAQELKAHVRSGDYIVTLATLLDSVSDNLTVENEAEAAVLQQLIENLIYIDKNYKLVKK